MCTSIITGNFLKTLSYPRFQGKPVQKCPIWCHNTTYIHRSDGIKRRYTTWCTYMYLTSNCSEPPYWQPDDDSVPCRDRCFSSQSNVGFMNTSSFFLSPNLLISIATFFSSSVRAATDENAVTVDNENVRAINPTELLVWSTMFWIRTESSFSNTWFRLRKK